jgi:large subunit ribosomal protein L25
LRKSNALFTLKYAGEEHLAIVKDFQWHPYKPEVRHIDFLGVEKGQKTNISVSIVLQGTPAPATITLLETQELEILADPAKLPSEITVDVEGLEAGSQIVAKDIKLPADTELVTDENTVVVTIQAEKKLETAVQTEEGEEETEEEDSKDAKEKEE